MDASPLENTNVNDAAGDDIDTEQGGGAVEESSPAASNEVNAEDEEGEKEEKEEPASPPTRWQRWYGWFLSDVLIYTVVLNLANELVSTIRIDRFSISLFVAVTLKVVLDCIQYLEHKAEHIFCHNLNRKFIGGLIMWLIVFGSKFLILWIDDVIFGSLVDLGYFWSILGLSLVLMLSQKLSRWLYRMLGVWERRRMEQKREREA